MLAKWRPSGIFTKFLWSGSCVKALNTFGIRQLFIMRVQINSILFGAVVKTYLARNTAIKSINLWKQESHNKPSKVCRALRKIDRGRLYYYGVWCISLTYKWKIAAEHGRIDDKPIIIFTQLGDFKSLYY